jgi:hypothetical protein
MNDGRLSTEIEESFEKLLYALLIAQISKKMIKEVSGLFRKSHFFLDKRGLDG